MSFDLSLFQFIHSFAGQFKLLDDLGIFIAQYLPYLMVLAAIFFIFRQNHWKNKLAVFGLTALGVIISRGILTEIIRLLWPRLRPFEALNFEALISESGASFPSGHAAFFFALALALFFFNRKWGFWFFALSCLNALARIFTGVHYPSDIFGGIIVALLGFWLSYLFLKPTVFKKQAEQNTAV